jgi:hypothetical protein
MQVPPGDPIVVSAFVENTEASFAGPFWVELWGSRYGGLTIDSLLTNSVRLDGMPGGASYSWQATQPLLSVPDGRYTVLYYVDRPGEVPETNECDNRAVVTSKSILVVRPQTNVDLVVENFSMLPNPAISGQPIFLSGQVVNRGSEPSGLFWIEFWGSWDQHYPNLNFQLCDSIWVANLDPGTSVSLADYSRQLYDVSAGTFWVGCHADRPDQINERDETNNYQFLAGHRLNTAAPAGLHGDDSASGRQQTEPDLVITHVHFSPAAPAQIQPGQDVDIGVIVFNQGTVDAGPFWVEYFGSQLGGLGPWAQIIDQSDRIPGLAAGTSFSITGLKPLAGIADGSWTVVAIADRLEEVAESDEGNNRYVVPANRALVVRPAITVNLVLDDFSLTSGVLSPGQPMQVNATVRNDGTTSSGLFWIEFWALAEKCYPTLDFIISDSIRVPNLAPGEVLTLTDHTATMYGWIPPGTYAIGCYVDRADQVGETEESDNYILVRNQQIVP